MMNPYLAKALYLFFQKIRKEPVVSYLCEMKRNDYLDREKIESIQRTRLVTLMKYAYENSPYYNNLFNENNIDIHKIYSVEDIKKIPILHKETFQKNLKDMLVRNFKGKYSVAKTSGSTGIPLKFIKDRIATAVHNATYYRGLAWHGLDIGVREAMLWGIPINAFQRYKIRCIDYLLNRFREKEYNLTDEVLSDFFKKLVKKKPEILSGYSSMIFEFAKYVNRKKLDAKSIGLKIVKCTSETIHDEYYDIVKKAFGCPLICEYGSAETGIVAFTCEEGGIHILSDIVLVEFEEPDENMSDSEYKELIVTPLYNFSLPIIRYKIGDFAIPETGSCKCGRGLPLVKKILGRSGSIVYGKNGRNFHSIIFYYLFKSIQDRDGGIIQFKVYQKMIDKIVIEIIKNDSFKTETLNTITNKVKEYLGLGTEIEINFVNEIKRERSGKLVDFVSEISK